MGEQLCAREKMKRQFELSEVGYLMGIESEGSGVLLMCVCFINEWTVERMINYAPGWFLISVYSEERHK